MPPKTVRCSICNETVLKSQTYATGGVQDGETVRACKVHDGVAEKAEELKKQQLQQLKSPKPKRGKRDWAQIAEENHQWAMRHCWCCERPGISFQALNDMLLVASEALRQDGKWAPFTEKGFEREGALLEEMMKMRGAKCIFVRFPVELSLIHEWRMRISYRVRPVAELTSILQLCYGCQEQTGIRPNTPKIDLKTLTLIGSIYQGSDSQKEVSEAAKLLRQRMQQQNLKGHEGG